MSTERTQLLRLGIAGFGLIGRRRAQVAAADRRVHLVAVADPAATAREGAAALGASYYESPVAMLAQEHLDLLVVAAPNGLSAGIAADALGRGAHVLVEKPPGANLDDCRHMAAAASINRRILKIGFNHRYHPALAKMAKLVHAGEVGPVINIRGVYGHGGRAGYEREWRADRQLAGGGELMDQGVHMLDLLIWLLGPPESVFALLQTAAWPIEPLEDNGFALLRFPDGAVASLHCSWTQWKNRFLLEVFGATGAITVEGLGGSYGTERLTIHRRRPEGGPPDTSEESFAGPDGSWLLEWEDFLGAVMGGHPYLGTPEDGLAVMTTLAGLYESARAGSTVHIHAAAAQRQKAMASPPAKFRRAVFLDRDGVLNRARWAGGVPSPPASARDFEILPGVAAACERLARAGWHLFVVTNQPDVRRGRQSVAEIEAMHAILRRELPLDEIRVCYHDDDDACPCRKPKPGMLLAAAAAWDLDLTTCFMIGDRDKDMMAGRAAGCRVILVGGHGGSVTPDFEAPDLAHAAAWILRGDGALGE